MPHPLAKGGKPAAGLSAIDKAREVIEKARVIIEKKQEGYTSCTVVSNDGIDKKSKSPEYIITVADSLGHKFKTIVPSLFLNKKSKLLLPEMGASGSTLVISARKALKPQEFYDHGCMTIRNCIETEYIVEG